VKRQIMLDGSDVGSSSGDFQATPPAQKLRRSTKTMVKSKTQATLTAQVIVKRPEATQIDASTRKNTIVIDDSDNELPAVNINSKAISPVKKAQSPVKKVISSVKKISSPVKKTATPVKRAAQSKKPVHIDEDEEVFAPEMDESTPSMGVAAKKFKYDWNIYKYAFYLALLATGSTCRGRMPCRLLWGQRRFQWARPTALPTWPSCSPAI